MTAVFIASVCGAAAGMSALLIILWLGNNLIKTTHYTVKLGGIKSGVRVVQVSDLHGKLFGAHNEKLALKVAGLKPDFIAITGDIIHCYDKKNVKAALETASTLSAIAPVLYVSGNHEMRNKGYGFFRKQLIEAGVTVLDNTALEICGITVVGLNGAHNKNGTLYKIADDRQNKILLAHMPQYIDNYAAAGYGLVLSGHAHGGQWRIPFLNRGIYAPGQGLFPKYTSGLHKKGDTVMIISRGLGNSEFPIRLFNRPELVLVEVLPDSSAAA